MELFVRALESCSRDRGWWRWGWGWGGELEGMGLRLWRWVGERVGGAAESCSAFSQGAVFVLIWCGVSLRPKRD